jgi:hypothetical protein
MRLHQQQKLLTTPTTVSELSTEISIVVTNKLVQHGMVFVSGEVIKECIVSGITTLMRSLPEK